MKRTGLFFAAALVAGAGLSFAGSQPAPAAKKAPAKASAGEGKLQIKDLPPPVRTTVEAETTGVTLKGISKEKEHGKTVYEVETLVNGRTRDLMIDATGKVYEVEEQLDVDKAPAPVKAAMEAKGKILKLESVTENGKTTYEGRVQTKSGKKVSVAVDANGKHLKP